MHSWLLFKACCLFSTLCSVHSCFLFYPSLNWNLEENDVHKNGGIRISNIQPIPKTSIWTAFWARKFHSESEVAQSCLTLCDPCTAAHQAPLSMGFSRQEYWSGLPFSPPGDLPDPRIKPTSPALAVGFFTTSSVWEVLIQTWAYFFLYYFTACLSHAHTDTHRDFSGSKWKYTSLALYFALSIFMYIEYRWYK